MPNLLVIDTSTAVCTVALVHEGRNTVKQIEGARSHGQFLLSTINEVVERAQLELSNLDALAVVSGPGSFTGIRIGVGVMQGLATALNIPVILLSSMQWLACTAVEQYDCSAVLVCCAARDSEYYSGFYTREQDFVVNRLGDEKVVTAEQIEVPNAAQAEAIVAVGDGWMDLDAFDDEFLACFIAIDAELAGNVDRLCDLASNKYKSEQWVSAEQVLPSYLKENMHYKTAI